MAQNPGKLMIYGIILVLILWGLARITLNSSGKTFWLELIGLLGLLLLSLLGFFGYSDRWGESLLFSVFFLYLINLLLLWLFKDRFYATLSLLSVIGFLLSFPRRTDPMMKKPEEPHSMVFDPGKEEKKESTPSTALTASPRSRRKPTYVGSVDGKVYHHRKCEWVNNIKEKIWFKSKKEAQKRKYKRHKCVR